MRIEFTLTPPEYRVWNLTVGFPATVDSRAVDCSVSATALTDHFGAPSCGASDMLHAFIAHRREIERTARRLLRDSASDQLVLRSDHFRFAPDDAHARGIARPRGRAACLK